MSSFEKHYAGLDITASDNNGKMRPVSRVTLYVDDKNSITAGDDTGLEISAECPNATQAIANTLLARFNGFRYQAMSADDANIDPAVELGDGITADGMYSVIARISDDGSGYVSVSAPGEEELEDEYPMDGPLTRAITQATDRKIADTRSSITKTAEQIRLEVSQTYATKGALGETETRLSSSITQTATSIKNEVSATYATKTALSSVEQTANKITWLVKSGTSSSNFELTDRAIKLVSETIELTGFVTFDSLKTKGSTEINGANIQTGTISADKLSVSDLSALKATIGGWSIGSTTISQSHTADNHKYDVTIANYANSEASSRVFHCAVDGTDTFYVRRNGNLYATSANITGEITATSGKIGKWTIGDALYSGTNSMSSTTVGTYLGTDGIRNYASGSKYVNITGGVLTAKGANIEGAITATSGSFTGEVTATSGTIGGFTLSSNQLYGGDGTIGYTFLRAPTATNTYVFGSGGTSLTSTTGYKFLLKKDGSLTATGVDITGEITATSGKIGKWTIGDALYSGTNSMSSTTVGTYLGTDGIRNYASGSKYVNITGGVLTAKGANIEGAITATSGSFTGKVTATSGDLGGWTINSNGIVYETANGLYRVTIRYPDQASPGQGVFYVGSRTSSSGNWSYPFRVNGDGTCSATKFKISGESSFSANLDSATGDTNDLTLGGTTENAGTISSGTLEDASINSSTLGWGTGGTYVGTCSGSTLSSCTTGGTSLAIGSNGSVRTYGNGDVAIYATSSASLSCGANSILVGSSSGAGCIIIANTQINKDLTCLGEKKRVIKTKNYGYRGLHAFETPLPTFSDYGTASLDEAGVFHIIIDPVFAETVNDTYLPTVFLTKYGEGDIWVDLVEHDIITVRGTPGLAFAWETRYAQANAEIERMQVMDFDYQDMSTAHDFQGDAAIAYEHSKINIDYAQIGYEYFTNFERKLKA